ncbi:hypothetical protein L227DRAFT_571116 [Lentinus tigrinus ALCF2SS1-6]|uniref:Uncharacterized protein n=1 Tax=Lentinus tigrinus ALCF2SS1-6 TaxID=1328759 RepID=A0A5C2SLB7_9APHY|nr:hypothetical protein L227DRAFT_571116 [Lentinus tigrinus ALCF2SS1-6]
MATENRSRLQHIIRISSGISQHCNSLPTILFILVPPSLAFASRSFLAQPARSFCIIAHSPNTTAESTSKSSIPTVPHYCIYIYASILSLLLLIHAICPTHLPAHASRRSSDCNMYVYFVLRRQSLC